MEPFRPSTRPALSYMVARSVYMYPGKPRRPGTSSLAAETLKKMMEVNVMSNEFVMPRSYRLQGLDKFTRVIFQVHLSN